MVRLVSGIKNMGFLHKMEYNWDSNNFSIHIYILQLNIVGIQLIPKCSESPDHYIFLLKSVRLKRSNEYPRFGEAC